MVQTEDIAMALASHLKKRYPRGRADNNNEIPEAKTWLGQLIDKHIFTTSTEEDSTSLEDLSDCTEYCEVARAIPIAISLWQSEDFLDETSNESTNSKAPASSFSLLDQLQGSLLANFVAIEDIIEASSDEERLTLLRKVGHVDDIIPDWDQIFPILSESLHKCCDHLPMSLEYLQLHRIWFDQGRSSAEYACLQYDLCRSVMSVTQARVTALSRESFDTTSNSSNVAWYNDSLLTVIVQTWHEMWLDLMQRGVYSEQLAGDIEATMLLWLQDFSFGEQAISVESAEPFPSHAILALIDPIATWLFSWTRLVSPQRLIMLIERTGILPSILKRCARTTAPLRPRESDGSSSDHRLSILNRAIHLHSIAALRALIVRTRVSHFPWLLLSSESPLESQPMSISDFATKSASISLAIRDGTGESVENETSDISPTDEQLRDILEIFLVALEEMKDDMWVKLCGDAIEAILFRSSSQPNPFEIKNIEHRIQSIENAANRFYIGTLLHSLGIFQ